MANPFKQIWEGWKWVAEKINWFMTGVLCTVLFFTVLPFWSVMRFWDPLRKKLGGQDSYWEPYRNSPATLDRFMRPF